MRTEKGMSPVMTTEVRTCARDGCENTFTPKVKGMRQIYCSASCRTRVYQDSLPSERRRQWWRDYYYRNLEACRAKSREYQRSLCECSRRKESPDLPMCSACAAMPSAGHMLRSGRAGR